MRGLICGPTGSRKRTRPAYDRRPDASQDAIFHAGTSLKVRRCFAQVHSSYQPVEPDSSLPATSGKSESFGHYVHAHSADNFTLYSERLLRTKRRAATVGPADPTSTGSAS